MTKHLFLVMRLNPAAMPLYLLLALASLAGLADLYVTTRAMIWLGLMAPAIIFGGAAIAAWHIRASNP